MCTLPTILHIHLYGQANWMSYSVRRPSQPERQEHRRHMPRTYLLVSLLTFEHVLPLSRQVAASSMRCAQCSEDLVLGSERRASTVLPEAWIVTVTELGGTASEVDVPASVQTPCRNLSCEPCVTCLYQVGANCNLPTPSLTGSR